MQLINNHTTPHSEPRNVTLYIIFQHTIYVTILDGDKEHPLLDSRFPDVSGKGRGYQIQSCPEGLSDWEELRKVSVWQTVGALEQVSQ